ncbi:MAG TPA: CDC27 family protein [Sulfurovum sp.]|jgi:hypothetical protein|nr:MAG: hypothetical protein B7Y63_00735 [Sulfurovum sp. 35-42-20]OYZ25716.1 MAG: hypothetical protein B7Y23_04175 [Sulfurovum sp. 16-42-52]OYZ50296.1 MAG: hypothetical protein B7Y13_01670 [Sulfurovum sp. 24-42-9]OZA45121.1 MAG: hypothetical protein B7X80_06030 [Sulfurovum sp. 17-42-90]HQS72629.1 CDC27 family protein [Sulfurovum sp.]
MYDIKPLEEEWKKYRNKKLRPWYILSIVLTLLITLIVLFWGNGNADRILNSITHSFSVLKQEENKVKKSKEHEVKSSVLVDSALMGLEIKEPVKKTIEEESEKPSDILVDVPILEEGEEVVEQEVPQVRQKIHLDIVETTGPTAYADVEKRFLQTRDIDDALFLANSYFNKGNYKKAEYWSMQANKLDGETEESLLIFVKSKIKLGYKNEGISILTSYVERSNSEEAKKLLQQIKSGKF